MLQLLLLMSSVVDIKKPTEFEGCILYEVSYSHIETEDKKKLDALNFLIDNTRSRMGRLKESCYFKNGDLVISYPESDYLDKVVYIWRNNTEYTVFHGVIRKEVANTNKFVTRMSVSQSTEKSKKVYGLDVVKFEVDSNLSFEQVYGSPLILLNKQTYTKNAYSSYYEDIGLVPLLIKKNVNGFITTTKVRDITIGSPENKILELPELPIEGWPD